MTYSLPCFGSIEYFLPTDTKIINIGPQNNQVYMSVMYDLEKYMSGETTTELTEIHVYPGKITIHGYYSPVVFTMNGEDYTVHIKKHIPETKEGPSQ